MRLWSGALSFIILAGGVPFASSAQILEDFRQTNQRAALLGIHNEFLETSMEESLGREIRRNINRYTTTYSASDIGNFLLPNNPAGQYFRPTTDLSDTQRQFLRTAVDENEIDIVVLSLMRESAVGVEVELQLYDGRIGVLSGVERSSFSFGQRVNAIEELAYRVFDHLDREGFVHPSRQGFLARPTSLQTSRQGADIQGSVGDDFFVLPRDLAGPSLAGRASIGGEKTPFWEEWWFWTLVFGGLAAAGGVSYYLFVVDQPPRVASVQLNLAN